MDSVHASLQKMGLPGVTARERSLFEAFLTGKGATALAVLEDDHTPSGGLTDLTQQPGIFGRLKQLLLLFRR